MFSTIGKLKSKCKVICKRVNETEEKLVDTISIQCSAIWPEHRITGMSVMHFTTLVDEKYKLHFFVANGKWHSIVALM